MAVMVESGNVTVLLSLKPPDGTTRFVDQIVAFKPDQETVKFFSWREAILGKYDVFHLHWPEWILRHDRRAVQWVKYVLASIFLLRLAITSTPVVRTMHNLEPHRRGPRTERLLAAAFDRLTTDYIALNPLTPCRGRRTIIRHGHYVDRFSEHPRNPVVPGRILFFGRIEPYKNVVQLISAFEELASPHLSLRIVGSIQKSAFADGGQELLTAVERTPGVSGKFEFVSDAELVAEITASQLVVLHYTEMHNSGALLVALSLGRVVWSTPTPVNKWVQEEVGKDWLVLDEELTSAGLAGALERSSRVTLVEGAMPDLSSRDWSEVARQHYEVYVAAVRSAGRSAPWKR